MAFTPFEPGEIVTEVRIISGQIAKSQSATNYRVQYLCCGAYSHLSHRKLAERGRKQTTRCPDCARRATGIRYRHNGRRKHEEPYPVHRMAPPPPSVLENPEWQPR